MITKKTYIEPSIIIELTVLQKSQLLHNVSVEEWNEGNDHNWGGDEEDESSTSNESPLSNERKRPFRVLWTVLIIFVSL